MKSPYSNPYLSARAKGIFAYYAELGRPVSADEMSAVMPEGRDALQSAVNELRHAGYIITVREKQTQGKWASFMKFTEGTRKLLGIFSFEDEMAKSAGQTDNGISGLLYSCTTESLEAISSIAIELPIVELLRSSTISGNSFPSVEGDDMPWNLDGDETPKKVKVGIDDDNSGAVGKVMDKAAMRKAKYAGQGLTTDPIRDRRDFAEEQWETRDLIAEFKEMLDESSAGHLTMQLNTKSLAQWVNQQVSKGATRMQMLSAMRMFFEDPRNLHNAGTGIPLWRRFIAYYQSVEGKVLEERPVYMTEADMAHQQKMLKLLGGNK